MNKIEELGIPSKVIDGIDYKKIRTGTIVKVIRPNHQNDGLILIKTSLTNSPFISLQDGSDWGTYVDDYKFLIVSNPIQIN